MAEYIERLAAIDSLTPDALIKRMDSVYDSIPNRFHRAAKRVIAGVPAADVRPVVRGEWLKSPECPEEYDICSVCGLNDKHRTRGNAEHPAFESIPPFCKWCGADMRKG